MTTANVCCKHVPLLRTPVNRSGDLEVVPDVLLPDRVLIYGVTGSGKSTLGTRLAALTGLPYTSVDDLTWEPDWQLVPAESQREKFEAICAADRWILDTAYGQWIDIPLRYGPLIVALDYPRWISLTRLLRRTLRRIVFRERVCNGNVESVRKALSPDSIVVWHFRSFASKQARIAGFCRDPYLQVHRFRHPREAEVWLRSLARRQG